MKISILFAPIHYILDAQNAGSEFSWSYQIYKRISEKKEITSAFITGGIRDIKDKRVIDCHVFTPQQLNLSLINIFTFYFIIFFKSIAYAKQHKITLLHHVLPFAIDNSFNLYALFVRPKFVIGPVQSGLTVHDTDVSASDALGFKKRNGVSLKEFIEKIALYILKPIIAFLSMQTIRIADKIIVVNQYTKQLLIERNIPEEKLVIIPPGIDVKKFAYKQFNQKKSSVTEIIAVGHLRKRKGIDVIIKAMQLIVKKKKNVRLKIVGDGPQRESLESLVKELKLSKWVTFVGFVPNAVVSTYYQDSHIFVNMSKSEAFATICLEAMASGLAIVSSRVGGFSDSIIEGENGYLVDKEDHKSLAEHLLHLINNPQEIEKFGKKSRKLVEEYYDWNMQIIPQYINVYNELAKQGIK